MSGMSGMGDDIHDLVHAFADGELEPAEAEAFREHLGTCEQCQAELDDILQLQALSGRLASMDAKPAPAPVEAARPVEAPSSRAFRPAWSRRRRAGLSVLLGGALAAAFAVAVLRTPGNGLDSGKPEALALAPTRSMEARLSYEGASGWRPYGVKRSGNERALEMVPLETQARLEKAGDLHGLATTFMLRGERELAVEYLGKLSSSPDVDSDRAVVALSKGSLEEALILLEQVLEKAPNHAPALWNRGLVLRELGLDLLAAESFGKVAALNEPGWSSEAREYKALLERQGRERHNQGKAVWDAGELVAEQGTLLATARAVGDPWLLMNAQVQNLGRNARFLKGFALTRAYLQESALREPEDCPTQIHVREALATVRMFELRMADARAELEGMPQCGAEPTLFSAYVLAELARVDPKPGDVEEVLALLDRLRASGTLQAGTRLMADHVEGRVRLLQDRAAGQRVLREVITASEKLPREEMAAQRARAASYSMLILDAGKTGEYSPALELFTEEVHAPSPSRCMLGVELAFERTLVAARGAAGELVGAYDASRRTLDFDVETLVPEPVLAALRPCEQVQVFARYPLHLVPGGPDGAVPP